MIVKVLGLVPCGVEAGLLTSTKMRPDAYIAIVIRSIPALSFEIERRLPFPTTMKP